LALAPSVAFFAVRLPVMHGKDSSPCIVRHDAHQWDFTVQYSTVCSLSCASTTFCLCRAHVPGAHGKPPRFR
jgi:hypothetical protein